MQKVFCFMFIVLASLSANALQKEILKGAAAQEMYNKLILAEGVKIQESMHFGDSEHPELGRLWMTTIFVDAAQEICWKFDFRESSVIDYTCSVTN